MRQRCDGARMRSEVHRGRIGPCEFKEGKLSGQQKGVLERGADLGGPEREDEK